MTASEVSPSVTTKGEYLAVRRDQRMVLAGVTHPSLSRWRPCRLAPGGLPLGFGHVGPLLMVSPAFIARVVHQSIPVEPVVG